MDHYEQEELEFIEEFEDIPPTPTSAGLCPRTSGDSHSNAYKKEQLAALLASGKAKEFLGNDYTLTDMNKWNDKTVDKHYNRYVTVLASKTSESITSSIIKGYCSLVSKFTNTDKVVLEEELNNDYIITRELGKLTGFFNWAFGSPTLAIVNILLQRRIFLIPKWMISKHK